MDKIIPNLINEVYYPTVNVKSKVGKKDLEGSWHPTAKMRLYTLSCYLLGQNKVEKYIVELGKSSL